MRDGSRPRTRTRRARSVADSALARAASVPESRPRYTFSFTPGEARAFRPRELDPRTGAPLSVSQWADRYRTVTEGGRQGPWATDFAAYTRAPMDAWNIPSVREIILCWAPQSSKTQVALNCVGYAFDQDPGPVIWTSPDENKAKDAVSKKLRRMIESSVRLRELLPVDGRRWITSTSIQLENGAFVQATWAGSAAQLASDSYKYGVEDETEKFPQYAGREADPDSLIEQRFIAYSSTYKRIKASTPAIEGGIIWRGLTLDADEVYDYAAVCPIPSCAHLQVMRFENITWPAGIRDPRTVVRNHLAHYSCEACGMKWTDRMRNDAVRDGRWVARASVPGGRPVVLAFQLPSWYSPFVSLSRVAAAYLRGLEDPAKRMIFVTQHKAEAYVETLGDRKEAHQLLGNKIDLPPLTCPRDTIALTCGVDPSKGGYWFSVIAWTRDLAPHLVHYGFLIGHDALRRLWYENVYPVQGLKTPLRIWRKGMDTGGSRYDGETQTMTAAYQFIRECVETYRDDQVFGTKGADTIRSGRNMYISSVDKMPGPGGKLIPGGLALWLLKASYFKDTVHMRLGISPGDPGRFTFHSDTKEDYVRHLAGEEKRRGRDLQWKWVEVGPNHMLDATVIAFALADPECYGGVRVLEAPTDDEPAPPYGNDEPDEQSSWILKGSRRELLD